MRKEYLQERFLFAYKNLKGVYNVNKKALSKISLHLDANPLENNLNVFIDIEGIYKFLKTPLKKGAKKKYTNIEAFNNRDLSNLFRRNKKVYLKGRRVKGFISSLDLDKIYDNCDDLKEGVMKMNELIK